MNTYLVLKRDPNEGSNPLFEIPETTSNSIEFTKTQTKFDFNAVFNNANKETIFDTIAKPFIDDHLLQNKDALLFTLGPTNSGKSHLMFKNDDSILTQTLSHLFDQLQGDLINDYSKVKNLINDIIDNTEIIEDANVNTNSNKAITISMFEIHRDKIKDLLLERPINKKVDLGIITDKVDGKLRPHHMTRYLVNTFQAADKLVKRGLSNRRTCSTNINIESSRSHCFIFIDLHNLYGNFRKSYRLTLADLAGLERSKTSKTTGNAFKETNYTNNSMTALGLALEGHAIKQFNMSSLRANKLTRLIMTDHIKSNMAVSLVVALDPFGEQGLVHQTLRYINPIKYQDLKRKITKPLINRRISQNTHQGVIRALTGYANEWKDKYESSKEELTLNETKLRQEMYELKEREIHDLELSHKTERQRLKERFDDELNQKIDELNYINKDKIDKLNSNLTEMENSLKSVQEESTALKSELEIVYKEKLIVERDLNDIKDNLDSKVEKLEIEVQSSNDKAIEYQEEINASKLEIEELKREIGELSTQVEVKNDNIKELNDKLSSNQQALTQLGSEKAELEKSLQDLRESLTHKSATNSELEKKLNETLNLLETKTAEVGDFAKRIQQNKNSHSEIILKLEEDLKMEQFRVESLESMKSKLEDQLNNLKDQHLATVNTMKTEFATRLTEEQSQFEDKIDSLEREKSQTPVEFVDNERLISYEMTIKDLNEEIDGQKIVLDTLQLKINQLTEQNENSNNLQIEKDKINSENCKLIDQLKSKNATFESDYKVLKEKFQSLDTENAKHIEKLIILKEQMEDKECNYLKQINSLTVEVENLKKDGKEATKRRKSLVEANTSLLDTDFAESFNIIKDIKSSPIKPSFNIHQDSSPSTPSRTKKSGKLKRSKSDIAKSKLDFALGKTNSKYSATPSPKKTPLGKLNDSAMNRKDMQLDATNLMSKLNEKKRKSTSPSKSKSKLRKVDLGELSFDKLD